MIIAFRRVGLIGVALVRLAIGSGDDSSGLCGGRFSLFLRRLRVRALGVPVVRARTGVPTPALRGMMGALTATFVVSVEAPTRSYADGRIRMLFCSQSMEVDGEL